MVSCTNYLIAAQTCALDTQQITAGVASCNEDNVMRHIEEGQRTVISVMCTNLYLSTKALLTEDVITHHEFMNVLADVAVSVNKLSMVRKGRQSFVKNIHQYLASTAMLKRLLII